MAANQFRFDWLPRIDGDYSQLPTFDRMARGEMKGYFLFGQNPAGGGINAGLHRAGLRNLDWLVVLDWFPTESATFWKDDPGAPPPSEIKTEVFLLPAAANPENDGCLTNTQRLLQWHTKAVDPPGDCRSDDWFVYNLGKRLRRLYADSIDPRDEPLLGLTWDYDYDEPQRLPDGSLSRIEDDVDAAKVLMEMNGYKVDEIDPRTGRPRLLSGFSELKDDGSTACGCWIYSGVYPEPGRNRAAERKSHRQPDRAGVGLRLAAQPPGALQPRVGRSRGPAVVRAEEAHLVGRRADADGWAPTSPTSSRRSRPTIGPRRERPAWRPSPAPSRSSSSPTASAGCSRPAASRTGPCRSTMSRSSRRSATCSIPGRRAPRACACSRGRSTTIDAHADARVSRSWPPPTA